jgi:hypothetical protein
MSTIDRSPSTIWTRSPGRCGLAGSPRRAGRRGGTGWSGSPAVTIRRSRVGAAPGMAVRGRGAAAGGGHRAAGRTGRERGTGAAASAAPRPAGPTPGTCAPWRPRARCRCPWIPPEHVSELRALLQASPAARRWPANCTGPGRWSRRSSGRSWAMPAASPPPPGPSANLRGGLQPGKIGAAIGRDEDNCTR